MTNDPDSLPPLWTILTWVGKRAPDLLVVVVVSCVIGEVLLRSPVARQPDYGPDPEMGRQLLPNQKSTIIGTVNSDRHRGAETDWDKPIVVGTGDSNFFGAGVAEEATWAVQLQRHLNQTHTGADLRVVNASHPAAGAYQQFVRLKQVVEKHKVEAIVVRVAIENREFRAPSASSLPDIQRRVIQGRELRAVTQLLPYLANKIEYQWVAIAPLFGLGASTRSDGRGEAVGLQMWRDQGEWYEKMVALSREHGAALVFVVHNPTDLPGTEYLVERLRTITTDHTAALVLELDSRAWGLRPGTTDQLWAQYQARFTQQHDLHVNEAGHALMARHIAAGLPGGFLRRDSQVRR